MFNIKNFTDNNDIKTLGTLGAFTVIEYQRDLSVMPGEAMLAYYCNEMNVRKRQVICDVTKSNITTQAGAMQWTVGNVNATTGVKGVGDLFGKALRGSVTGESAIKPEYTGNGTLVLEPTYKHILLVDVADWNGSIVLDDGLFLACESTLKHKTVMRSNLSSAALGNEGLFNLGIQGNGILCLESVCPKEELVEITLQDDVLKVDGNMAIAWSGSLNFTVERSGKSDWFCRLRRGPGQCVSRYRQGAAGSCHQGHCVKIQPLWASGSKGVATHDCVLSGRIRR